MPAGAASSRRTWQHADDIASANWFASVSLAARVARTALFVDMGSTTTDLVPIVDGAIAARAYTDAERLAAGELVYTGLVRSFVMAEADQPRARLEVGRGHPRVRGPEGRFHKTKGG
jgi:(4-(4-[2-(gamma-L-glutamylamino)ethyl]phenoxymethyl)furan-2-yl)methanamine synthase